jgi:hypothetical protein
MEKIHVPSTIAEGWKKGSELRKLGRTGKEEENFKFSKYFQELQF